MTYSPDEVIELLTAGATAIGRTPVQAAIHLLTFTALPHRRGFAESLEYGNAEGIEDAPATAAWVHDWTTLTELAAKHRLGGGDQRLIALAVSLGSGEPVDLAANVGVGGYAYARRLIEAVAIATGYGEMYEITPTAKLDQMIADRDALLGGN